MSGKEFMAHRKFAFHVFGSGLSIPGWCFPKKIVERMKVKRKKKEREHYFQSKNFWKQDCWRVVERMLFIPGHTYSEQTSWFVPSWEGSWDAGIFVLKPNSFRALLLLLSRFSRVRLCATPQAAAHQALPSLGFSRQEHWSGLPSAMHESEKWKWSHSVVSDSSWPHGLRPTRLLRPWDFPGKSTGVGCQC